MGTPTFSPFGSYTDVTGVIDAATKTEIQALLDELKRFVPTQQPDGGADQNAPSPSPDFDQTRPNTGQLVQAEIDGVAAAINAAPEA